MKVKKVLAIAVVIVMCFGALAGCGQGGGDDDGPIQVIIAHTDTSARSTHIWCLWLGEYLEEHAPGVFEVLVFPDGQLGGSPENIAGVGLGTITMAFEMSPVLATHVGPAASVVDLPFLFATYEDWMEGMFERGGMELYNQALAEVGFYCIDLFFNGMRNIISREGHHHTVADFRGMKVRIPQNDLNIAMWNAMGANPTPMSWGEVVTALTLGQIDVLDHSLGVFNDFNLHEIAPYITITNHVNSPLPLFVSIEFLESLGEYREIFKSGVRAAAAHQRADELALQDQFLERFRAEGASITELTPAEIAAFQEAVIPVYDMWREMVGDELIDKWLAIAGH